jgi:dTMP kinase
LLLRKKDIFKDYQGYTQGRAKLFRRRLPGLLFQNLLFFDQYVQVMFKIKLPLMLGRNVVCDRYIYDTIITDIMPVVDLSCSPDRIIAIIRNYASRLPKPDFIFLADAPEEIALSRKTDVPSIEYLRERRQVYLEVGRKLGMAFLDGTKRLELLKSEVETRIFQAAKSIATE